MGVDYRAHYGIGFEIETINLKDSQFDSMNEFLCGKINKDKYKYFEVGDEGYTGQKNRHFVVLKNPMSEGLDKLSFKKELLIANLKLIGLNVKSDFTVVGGLEVF